MVKKIRQCEYFHTETWSSNQIYITRVSAMAGTASRQLRAILLLSTNGVGELVTCVVRDDGVTSGV